MGRPKTVFSKIADRIGISRTSVRRALDEAGISEKEANQDFERAVMIATTFNDKDKTLGHNALGRGDNGGRSSAYTEAKAQAELHRARKLELQNAQLEASLISREAVNDTCLRIFTEIRTALAPLGRRVSDKLVGLTDAKAIERIVDDELRDVLMALTDEERFFNAIDDEALT